ncbi:MAG: hypothetical protein J7K54_00505 [Candidatus Aenigmarchaeota archaeon]|nr:hypothetical protein [Candidatus Aenigmarchaeota archaeon]
MEMDTSKAGIVIIAAVLLSLVWLFYAGVSAGFGLMPLAVFAVSLSAGIVLLEDWDDER